MRRNVQLTITLDLEVSAFFKDGVWEIEDVLEARLPYNSKRNWINYALWEIFEEPKLEAELLELFTDQEP